MATGISGGSRNITLPVAASSTVASPSKSAPSDYCGASGYVEANLEPMQQGMDEGVRLMEEGIDLLDAALKTLKKAQLVFKNTRIPLLALTEEFSQPRSAAEEKALGLEPGALAKASEICLQIREDGDRHLKKISDILSKNALKEDVR